MIGTSHSQVPRRLDKYQCIYKKKLIIFTLGTNTDSFRKLSYQVAKYSTTLVAEFNIINDGEELKKHQAYQENDSFGKNSKKTSSKF